MCIRRLSGSILLTILLSTHHVDIETTLISALTLDAFYGKSYGTVTLNGVPLTDSIFKRHCYVVKQHDKHWPYLTCKETLTYAAELYEVAEKDEISDIVKEIIGKMGLDVCTDTRCAQLSGGQRRRLSIAIALLKQPTLLFLGMLLFLPI